MVKVWNIKGGRDMGVGKLEFKIINQLLDGAVFNTIWDVLSFL